ncbi:hypothetical protein [Adlercreutzia sp. ZJ138]|uniref:hypothetical protein n=1 Tax=Adlercreutzia sp. ZJ138 TaxID=2709405 RepID=UPI0013EC11CE|nr:hypothetical protein [Adlercreutzia sp. ZJ138]
MPRLDWYPVQVMSGQERKMVRLITAACAEAGELPGKTGESGAGEHNGAGEAGGAFDKAAESSDIIRDNGLRGTCESDGDGELDDQSEPLKLDECFAPRYRTQKKMRGEWRNVERPLMPGYLIAVVNNPAQLARVLRYVNGFCRVVKVGQTYVPLSGYEREWLEANTSRGDRVVPMSFGHKVGGVLEVTQGPLKGYEGRIVGVKRADSLAMLEFHVGNMRIKTTVGLGILPD